MDDRGEHAWMADHLCDEDTVYLVSRRRRLRGWRRVANWCLDFLFLAGDTHLVADSLSGSWYLAVGEDGARVIQVTRGAVTGETRVAGFDPAWRTRFTSAVVGDYAYRRIRKVR